MTLIGPLTDTYTFFFPTHISNSKDSFPCQFEVFAPQISEYTLRMTKQANEERRWDFLKAYFFAHLENLHIQHD